MGQAARNTALITGAAGGIGRALALEFAADGYDIIGVDRSSNLLQELRAEIENKYPGANVTTIDMDLSAQDAAEQLFEDCMSRGLQVDTLVNNVGFGKMGEHVLQSSEVLTDMLSLNNLLMTKLNLLFGREMKGRGQGEILNIASLVGFSSSPFFSAYSGTKAYVISFSVGLAQELRPYGVQVSCLCPGTTETSFLDTAAIEDETAEGMRRFASAFVATPETVARAGFKGLKKRKLVIVPTLFLKLQSAVLRVLPIEFMSGFVHRSVIKANAKQAS